MDPFNIVATFAANSKPTLSGFIACGMAALPHDAIHYRMRAARLRPLASIWISMGNFRKLTVCGRSYCHPPRFRISRLMRLGILGLGPSTSLLIARSIVGTQVLKVRNYCMNMSNPWMSLGDWFARLCGVLVRFAWHGRSINSLVVPMPGQHCGFLVAFMGAACLPRGIGLVR